MKISRNQVQNINTKADSTSIDPRHPQVLKAAKMYEQYFLNEMVKAMRNTVSKSDLIQENMAEKIYKDQLYDKHVETWTDKGGIGLADLIYDKIMEMHQPQVTVQKNGFQALNTSKAYGLPEEQSVKIEHSKVELKPDGLYGVKKTGQKSSEE